MNQEREEMLTNNEGVYEKLRRIEKNIVVLKRIRFDEVQKIKPLCKFCEHKEPFTKTDLDFCINCRDNFYSHHKLSN